MKELIVKYASSNIIEELENIGFDNSYLMYAVNNYQGKRIKINNLKPAEANILKQLCLSLGFDCAVNKYTVTCQCEYTNCLVFASINGYKKLCEKLSKQPFRLKEVGHKIKNLITANLEPLCITNKTFDWTRPYIMGILNITPDSFSDGGKYTNEKKALTHVIKMIEDGADIIDIGGESTRPNARVISVDEEIHRVIPIIEQIRKENINIPISIDTRNYLTAKAAIDTGADIINDVSGFSFDTKLFEYVCTNKIPSIIVHSTEVPATSKDAYSTDIINEIYRSLHNKIDQMIDSGHQKSKIIADTGIGFGKSQKTCFEIVKRHDEFTSLGVPMLMGLSRKSFIQNEFNLDVEEADVPTALYSAILSFNGANIHRVHNVKMTKTYIDLASKIL